MKLSPQCRTVLLFTECVACQYSLPLLPAVSDHWLPVSIPIIRVFKLSSISSLHLLRGLPVFLILSIAAAAIVLALFGFAYCQPYLTLHHLTSPYLTLPYLTSPYITLPYLTLPYLALHYITLPYLTLPYLTLPFPLTYRYCINSTLSCPCNSPIGYLCLFYFFTVLNISAQERL